MAFDRALAGRGNWYDCVYADVDAKSARVASLSGRVTRNRVGAVGEVRGGGVADGWAAPFAGRRHADAHATSS